jgi:hypothetical protein
MANVQVNVTDMALMSTPQVSPATTAFHSEPVNPPAYVMVIPLTDNLPMAPYWTCGAGEACASLVLGQAKKNTQEVPWLF